MLKYKLPTNVGMFRRSLEFELRKIRKALSESRDEGYRGLLARSMRAFRDFIVSLGQPRYKFIPIWVGNNAVSLEYYNNIRKTIEEDLVAAEEDVSNLGHSSLESFNVAQILAKELETLAAVAASKAQDIAILSKGGPEKALVAGDSFETKNQVDAKFAYTMPQAFVDVRQGLVTLSRSEAVSAIDPENVTIGVEPLTPGVDRKQDHYKKNTNRFYEGRYYALAGQAEPEGGRWHLEELTAKPAGGGHYYQFEKWATDKQSKNYKKRGWTYDGDVESVNPIGAHVDQDGNLVIRNEVILRDRGATDDELKQVRTRMVDGSPDTYWQCEYVVRPDSFGKVRATLPGLRGVKYQVSGKGAEFGDVNAKGTPAIITDLRGTYTQTGLENDARLQVTPQDLRDAAAELDSMDLEISVTITLPEPVDINWITLLPMNFGETAWLKITDIATSESRNDIFTTLPGFVEGRTQNTLTEDVNAEVLDSTVEQTMSPSKYAYRGSGVWTFPTRTVQVVRFKIRQDVPTPVLYQKIRVQMHRTWNKNYRYRYNSSSRNLRSDKFEIEEWTKVITLDYLRSVAIMQGSLSAGDVAPTTEGGYTSSSTSGNQNKQSFLNKITGGLFGGSTSRSWGGTLDENDTGYYMTGYWVETFYDLIGYRIGIRELGAFRNIYQTSSEIISKPFYSPVDLKKVVLRVDDTVPDGTAIEYYVSTNGGENWHRINPLDKPSIYGADGYAVPKTISFNIPGNPGNEMKYVTTETPPRSMVFRAVFRSETSDVSPILRGYRLLMYPADSLSPNRGEE